MGPPSLLLRILGGRLLIQGSGLLKRPGGDHGHGGAILGLLGEDGGVFVGSDGDDISGVFHGAVPPISVQEDRPLMGGSSPAGPRYSTAAALTVEALPLWEKPPEFRHLLTEPTKIIHNLTHTCCRFWGITSANSSVGC